jgi:hypothetical protein
MEMAWILDVLATILPFSLEEYTSLASLAGSFVLLALPLPEPCLVILGQGQRLSDVYYDGHPQLRHVASSPPELAEPAMPFPAGQLAAYQRACSFASPLVVPSATRTNLPGASAAYLKTHLSAYRLMMGQAEALSYLSP